MKKMINMADPFFSPSDRKKIHEELDLILDESLSMGKNVKAFEKEFAELVGVRYAVAMNSCTSALEAALQAHDVAGREIILPAQTFIATGMAVHMSRGIPVLAEISEKTLCLDLEDVKQRINSKTAGIILVHMAGLVVENIAEFREFCDLNGLFLIEDAAHSPGAEVNGKQAGAFGNAGCFSFYPTKVITAGEGGMLTTDDEQVAAYARSYQHRGRDLSSPVETYSLPGRNVRMTEMAALFGRIQLGHLDEFLARRREITKIYRDELSHVCEIELVVPANDKSSSYWKLPLLLDQKLDRANLTVQMAERGVTVDWAYQPALHLQPVFKELYGFREGILPKTEDVLRRHLCLPCHPRMSDEDAFYVAQQLKAVISEQG